MNSFVLLSTFCNFDYRRSYWHSEKERKINFSFALLSFFRNFAITKQTFKTYLIYEKN